MPDRFRTSLLPWALFLWLPGLIAFQSIPGTGALRTLFLLLGIGHIGLLAIKATLPPWPQGRIELLLLALLTGWLILQSALVSPTPMVSLALLAKEWGKLVLVASLGIVLTLLISRIDESGKRLASALFVGFFIHVAATLLYQLVLLVRVGKLDPGYSFLGNYGYVSPFVTGALALLMAESIERFRGGGWLPMKNTWLVVAIVAALTAQTVLNAKASLVVTFLMLILGAALAGRAGLGQRWAMWFAVGLIFTMAGSVAMSNRWQGGLDAIQVALRTPTTDFETLEAPPLDPVPADAVHARGVWAKMALHGIVEHPFGLGYGGNAFGRYVVEQGGPDGAVSSHSGWLDFALANGIPGLLLLLGLLWAVMRRGWRAFHAGNPAGMATLLLTFNYFARTAIDGNLYGSRLIGMAFVIAVLWTLAARSAPPAHAARPD